MMHPLANGIPTRGAGPAPSPTRELTDCPLCGSDRLQGAHFRYVFQGATYPAVACPRCRLTFLARQPAGEGLRRLYEAEYFESDYHCGHDDQPYFASESAQMASASVLLEWIEQEVVPGRILELGCAGGYFLHTARTRGWTPVGVEISDAAARFARESLRLEVHVGSLDTASIPVGSLDAAYMGDVLEHLPDPLATLRTLHRLLRPGGLLLIAGPTTLNSLDRRLGLALYRWSGRTKTLRQPPYHLTEFTPRTLATALNRAGFEIRWLRQSKIPPAWRNPRRRAPFEHGIKLLIDGPNWLATRLLGRLGDRAIVLSATPPR